jgi:hypothetical protein
VHILDFIPGAFFVSLGMNNKGGNEVGKDLVTIQTSL